MEEQSLGHPWRVGSSCHKTLSHPCFNSQISSSILTDLSQIMSHQSKPALTKPTNTVTHLILCRLERSGLRLVNFWASFQTVMIKKKVLRTIMKHTGPKKLQMRPSSMDSQQLEGTKQTCDCWVCLYVTLLEKTEACVIHLCHTSGRHTAALTFGQCHIPSV